MRIWASSSFLRHYDEAQILLKSQPLICAIGADGGHIVIRIQDNGSGIAAAEHERVQQRFVRLESSRSTPGHGLGLSLVRAIAEAHGGRLVLGDAEPGLVAELRFPQRGAL
ncbi:sensor histidine kinase [Altererythrobacter sp. H2]|uniref:sensor histidine kinase n=1 Tax=Altererythrobacter sp. H2 TaxID=3108391 RepID=UPI002B4C109D|nr:sensor histidine kinase [Altererythrobacter sp. H2]WRK94443.1 sensor histidine kinase [Altererythrobacter sp. H2]